MNVADPLSRRTEPAYLSPESSGSPGPIRQKEEEMMLKTAFRGAIVALAAALSNPALAEAAPQIPVMEEVTVGDITLHHGFARATLPSQPVAGAFLVLTNAGTEDDALVGIEAGFAGRGEIHEMAMSNGVMRMRPLEGTLVIPAGQSVTLAPGGYHLMFFDLAMPLFAGAQATVTLTFEKAGAVEVVLPILAPNAEMPMHEHGAIDEDTGEWPTG